MKSNRTAPRRRWGYACAVVVAALSAAAAVPAVAEAQSSNMDIGTPYTGDRPFQLDIHAGFVWFGAGFNTGARFGIPLLDNGFIPSLNNAVYLNFGLDFYWLQWRFRGGPGGGNRWDYGPGLGFPVTLHWEFYFSEKWSAFAELGFQLFFHPRFFNEGRFDVYGQHWFVGQVGGSYHVNDWFLLTLRVGTPYAAFGLTFQF